MPFVDATWPIHQRTTHVTRANLEVYDRLEDKEIREEIVDTPGDLHYQTMRRKTYSIHRLASQCKSKQNVGFEAVRDDAGNPICETAQVCR